MNKLYHVVTNNINNKYHNNYAIEYEPKFDSKFSLSSGTKDPLLVVTTRTLGGKKHRATLIYSLTCMWYSGATNIMNKMRHTEPFESKIHSNKV